MNDIPKMIHILSKQRLPQDFINAFKSYDGRHQSYFVSKNITVPLVPAPTDKGLEKIAKKYSEKYHINISVCKEYYFESYLKNIENEEDFPRGIIVVTDNDNHKHVTPIILNKYQGNLEVLTLDVLGQEQARPFPSILSGCARRDIVPFCSEEVRQADKFSCRTNAVVTLRDALIDLKQKKEVSLHSIFVDKQERSFKVENSLFQLYSVANLPYSWRYGDQIYPKNNIEADEELIPRDLMSKNREKVEHPRKISFFRQKQTKQHLFEHTIMVNLKLFLEINKLDALPHEWNSDFFKVGIEGSSAVFTIKTVEKHNVYMTHKVFKLKAYCENDKNHLNSNEIL